MATVSGVHVSLDVSFHGASQEKDIQVQYWKSVSALFDALVTDVLFQQPTQVVEFIRERLLQSKYADLAKPRTGDEVALDSSAHLGELQIGDEVTGWFYGEWHPATIRSMDGSRIQVRWDSEYSVSWLDASDVKVRADVAVPLERNPDALHQNERELHATTTSPIIKQGEMSWGAHARMQQKTVSSELSQLSTSGTSDPPSDTMSPRDGYPAAETDSQTEGASWSQRVQRSAPSPTSQMLHSSDVPPPPPPMPKMSNKPKVMSSTTPKVIGGATSKVTDANSKEISQFIKAHDLDERTEKVFRSVSPEVQQKLLDRQNASGPSGGLFQARNPSAMLMAWIAESDTTPPEMKSLPQKEKVKAFIKKNNVDDRAAEALRTCGSDIQDKVINRGSLESAANPSAALMGRIEAAQKGK